jgi:hypothetical protein
LLGAILGRLLPPAAPEIQPPPESQAESTLPLTANPAPTAPAEDAGRLSAELALEVEEIERRQFPGGFPPLLARCVGHYLAGPSCMPPAEGASAWWEGARRQVLRLIEAVKNDPTRYAAWRPPEP